MRILLSILILLVAVPSWSQKVGANWIFAKKNQLTFAQSGVVASGGRALTLLPGVGQAEGPASISDSTGQLLFYTDGQSLWDWGDSLITDQLLGHVSSTQASLIVPVPMEASKYYVFTTDAFQNQYLNGLQYSVVHACLNDGVVVEEINTLVASPVTEKMCAIAHSNGVDYWLIAHDLDNATFLVYLISVDGVTLHSNQSMGLVHDTQLGMGVGVGAMKASPDGKQIVVNLTNHVGKSDFLWFDPTTGVLTHRFTIDMETVGYGFGIAQPYGASFSPNNSKVYISGTIWFQVAQFSVDSSITSEAQAISNMSVVHVDSVSNTPGVIGSFQHLQLGIDGKIYVANIGSKRLAVIHEPNLPGLQCNFEDSAVVLLHKGDHGLPSFIDSYHYTATGICDPLGIDVIGRNAFAIHPNPASTTATLTLPVDGINNILVMDAKGRVVYQDKTAGAASYQLTTANWPDGIYAITATNKEGVRYTSKLVVGR